MREEVCYSAVQSRCTQYVGTEGRIRSAGIKNENPWAMGREMREDVQTSRNRTVGVCEMGEHEERGSGKYELNPWVTRRWAPHEREAGYGSRGELRAQPLITRTPQRSRHPC